MVRRVILLGGHIQALGLARQAAEIGVRVVLFIEDAYSVARFSCAVEQTVIFGNIENLSSLLTPYQDTGALLFPTADEYVEYLAQNEKSLSAHFQLGIPNQRCVEIFGNKRIAYNFIDQLDVLQPKSWQPNTVGEIEAMADELDYPLVVKPAVMHGFHKMFGKKAFRCNTKDELIERCTDIAKQMPIDGVLLQEFLPGGPKRLYSYGVFAIDGIPKAWLGANRIRQNPMDFGNSTTFAITCRIPEIERASKKILAATEYTGLAEIEFMYDAKVGGYKFLEINTRAWKWHSISKGLGFGFLSEWLHHANNEGGDFKNIDDEVAWCEHLTDFVVIAQEVLKGRMRLGDVVASYKYRKQSAVWSIKDPLPALMYLVLSPILFIKRH